MLSFVLTRANNIIESFADGTTITTILAIILAIVNLTLFILVCVKHSFKSFFEKRSMKLCLPVLICSGIFYLIYSLSRNSTNQDEDSAKTFIIIAIIIFAILFIILIIHNIKLFGALGVYIALKQYGISVVLGAVIVAPLIPILLLGGLVIAAIKGNNDERRDRVEKLNSVKYVHDRNGEMYTVGIGGTIQNSEGRRVELRRVTGGICEDEDGNTYYDWL